MTHHTENLTTADQDHAMRIALYTDSDSFAGTERHMLDLAKGLADTDVECRVICPMPSPLAERCTAESIGVLPLNTRAAVDRAAISSIARLFRSKTIDLIHTHNGRSTLNAVLARHWAGTGLVIATQHFIRPAHLDRGGLLGLGSGYAHRWMNARVDHHIVTSDAVRRAALNRGGGEDRVTVIANGIVPPMTDDMPDPVAVRERFGVSDDQPLVVCAARLEHEKSIDALIEAMASVVRQSPDAVCLVAGEGSLHADLQADIDVAGLGRNVRLLGFREDVLALIAACDVFVLPSSNEPFGLVLLEAMALSRPVIAVRSGGPLEIVDHGRTGLLVTADDRAALAAAIQRLIDSPSDRQRMGRNGLARLADRFTAVEMSRATADVYRRLRRMSTPGVPASEALMSA